MSNAKWMSYNDRRHHRVSLLLTKAGNLKLQLAQFHWNWTRETSPSLIQLKFSDRWIWIWHPQHESSLDYVNTSDCWWWCNGVGKGFFFLVHIWSHNINQGNAYNSSIYSLVFVKESIREQFFPSAHFTLSFVSPLFHFQPEGTCNETWLDSGGARRWARSRKKDLLVPTAYRCNRVLFDAGILLERPGLQQAIYSRLKPAGLRKVIV